MIQPWRKSSRSGANGGSCVMVAVIEYQEESADER